MKIKINNNFIVLIELFLLVLLSVGQYFSLGYFNIIIVGTIGLLFLLSNIESCTIMLYTALPFFNLLNNSQGSTSLYYLYIIIFIIKYIIKNKGRLNKSKIFILVAVIFFRSFCFDIEHLSKWILLFSVLVLTYNEDFFMRNIKEIINYTTISFIITSFVGYVMLVNGKSIYIGSFVHSTIRFAGLVGDSVFFSQLALLLCACNYILLYYAFNIKNLIFILIMYFFIALTYSKTGILLAVFLFLAFYIIQIFKNSKRKKDAYKSLVLIILLFMIVFFGVNYIAQHTSNEIISNYIDRFNSSDLSTGRIDIAKHYLDLISNDYKSWFVSMSTSKYFEPFYPNLKFMFTINRAHNIYIESLCAFGIIPSVFIFAWLINKLFFAIKRKKIFLLPILIMFVTGFSLHGLFEFHYLMIFSLALVFLSTDIESSFL